MKVIVLIAICVLAGSVQAQSLKDALYGGRLKNDTGAVIKKTDTLQIKENMAKKVADDSTRKAEDAAKKASVAAAIAAGDTTVKMPTDAPVETGTAVAATTTTAAAVAATAPKDNNKIWKDFVEEYTTIIKSEVIPNKKIKNGTYSVLIEYEIGLDGYVTTSNISVSPESSYLQEQVKLRMMNNAPQMNPVLMSNGKPRKALKKQMLTFSKEK